ncbi:MAG TPA: thiamine phosphate synthase [Polyangiaceae bacterium]
MNLPELIAITDPSLADDRLADLTLRMLSAVPRGSVGIQVRDKVRPASAMLSLAERLHAICAPFEAPLYVNDRLDIALGIGAQGVHLGSRSVDANDARRLLGPSAFISVAAHGVEDLVAPRTSGATAALVSPVFSSPGKGPPGGTDLLSDARRAAPHLRIYALGGVAPENIDRCAAAGADGVAAIRALWTATDIAAVAGALVSAMRDERAARRSP